MNVVDALARSERAKALLRPLANRVVGHQPRTVTVRGGEAKGLRLEIDPQTEKYYWTGGHEPHVQAALRNVLRPGMTVWDVGTHIGFFALQAARLVGPTGHVTAYEPMPGNVARLRRNSELNNAQVEIVQAAVGETTGELPIYECGGSSLMWTLDPQRGERPQGIVPVTTLDAQRGTPDLVKVDAEGYELAVLRGAGRAIAGGTMFIVEFMTDELLREGRNLLDGYELSHLGDNHWLAR